MKITWIDPKGVLRMDKKFYRAGDEIPAGSLSAERIALLKSQKKIRIGEEKKATVTQEIYGMPVETVVPEKPVPVEPEKPKTGKGKKQKEEVAENDDSTEG